MYLNIIKFKKRKIEIRKISVTNAFLMTIFSFNFCYGQEQSIEEFVKNNWIHDVPKELAEQFDDETVPKLHAMLDDDSQKEYWHVIVKTLGYIGNGQTVHILKRFYARHLREDTGAVGQITTIEEIWLTEALVSVRHAMGFLGRRGYEGAVEFLKLQCNKTELEKMLNGKINRFSEEQSIAYYRYIMRGCVGALTLVSTEQSISILENMYQNAQSYENQFEDPKFKEIVKQSILNARNKIQKEKN